MMSKQEKDLQALLVSPFLQAQLPALLILLKQYIFLSSSFEIELMLIDVHVDVRSSQYPLPDIQVQYP